MSQDGKDLEPSKDKKPAQKNDNLHESRAEPVVLTSNNQNDLKKLLESLAMLRAAPSDTTPEHKFWNTQPVPQHEDKVTELGPIESSVPVDQVTKTPPPLPKEFEWCEVDVNDEAELKELYQLLSLNYVEDDDEHFRFDYSAKFLKWALQPPGWRKSWHVGVRVTANKKLVAFISGIPVDMRTQDKTVTMTEINFLCVHKKLRSKRLAPVMIREITRRSHLEGIFQAVYTAGKLLPKPVATCRYYHRSLNPKKLVECQFSRVPPNSTLKKMIQKYHVPDTTSTPGLRIMTDNDAPAVRKLLNKFLMRYDLAPHFTTDEDVKHWIAPHESVVWSYVVECPKTKAITDMVSFYALPSSVIGNDKHKVLNAAYMFYYAVEVPKDENEDLYITKRLRALVEDVLVEAKKAGFDVVNALTLMENEKYLEHLKFGPGDGYLNFYLYNWLCPDVETNKVGLLML